MNATVKLAKNAGELATSMQRILDNESGTKYCKVTREQLAEWFCTVDWIATEVETIAEAEDIYNGTR